jgi:glycosyltransferase 2 family protein
VTTAPPPHGPMPVADANLAPTSMQEPPRRRGYLGRLFPWLLAIAAFSFVGWMIPVRDRCWDTRAPASTRVAVSRSETGCVLHLRSGEVSVDAAECAGLRCEPGIGTSLSHARPGILAGLLGIYAFGTLAWAARWRALLSFAGIDLPLSTVWRISIEAQAGGILLPGGLGGDALRIASVMTRPTVRGQARSPMAIVVASVLLDRAVGLSLVAGIAALMGLASGGVRAGPLVAMLGAIPLAVGLGLVLLRRAPSPWVARLSNGRGGRHLRPVLTYLRDLRAPRAIAKASSLSVVVAAVQFSVIRGLVFALGAVPTEEKWIYIGTAMAFIVSVIPALPGAWGTADLAYVFFFGLGGVGSGVALAVCLLFRLFWYVAGIVGAILRVSRREVVTASLLD